MYTPPPDTSGWVPSAPNWYEMPRKCFACRGDDKNGRGKPEDPAGMLKCKGCKCYFHPSCARLSHIADTVRGYGWKCDRCSKCEVCRKDDDEEHYFYCHHCNRAYHTVCLNPQLPRIPGEEWKCKKCEPTRTARENVEQTPQGAEVPDAGPSQPRKRPSMPATTQGSALTPPSAQVKRSKETSRVSQLRALHQNGESTPSASPAPGSVSGARPSQPRNSTTENNARASSSTSTTTRRTSKKQPSSGPHAKDNRTPEEELEFADFCATYEMWSLDNLEAAWVAGEGNREAAEDYLVQLLESERQQLASAESSRPPKRPRSNSNASAQVTGSGRARSSVTASPSKRRAGPGRNTDGAVVSEDDDHNMAVDEDVDGTQDRPPDSGTPEPVDRSELPRSSFKRQKRQKTVQFASTPGASSSTTPSERERSGSVSRPWSATLGHEQDGADGTAATSSSTPRRTTNLVPPNFDWATQLAQIENAPSNDHIRRIFLEHYAIGVDDGVQSLAIHIRESALEALIRESQEKLDNLREYRRDWDVQMGRVPRPSSPPSADVPRDLTRRSAQPRQSASSDQQQHSSRTPSARALGKRRDPGPST